MTIEFDRAAGSNPYNTDASFSHTVGEQGKNGILMIGVACQYELEVTAVTYAGDAATRISSNSPSTNVSSYLYYLLAPKRGENTVSVTWAGAQGNSVVAAASYFGVDQASPFGTEATTNGTSGASFSNPLTSAQYELCFDWAATAADDARAAVVVGSGQTERHNDVTGSGGASVSVGMSEIAGAPSVTMSYTNGSAGNDFAYIALPMKPAVAEISRAIHYFYDIYDPQGRILDARGRPVEPWRIRPNRWIKVTGIFTPTSKRYSTFTQDPEIAYIEEVEYSSRGGLRIKTSRGELTEVLLARAAGSKTL